VTTQTLRRTNEHDISININSAALYAMVAIAAFGIGGIA
jgi:hypothetical protein